MFIMIFQIMVLETKLSTHISRLEIVKMYLRKVLI